jgi:hypothetical protein
MSTLLSRKLVSLPKHSFLTGVLEEVAAGFCELVGLEEVGLDEVVGLEDAGLEEVAGLEDVGLEEAGLEEEAGASDDTSGSSVPDTSLSSFGVTISLPTWMFTVSDEASSLSTDETSPLLTGVFSELLHAAKEKINTNARSKERSFFMVSFSLKIILGFLPT